MVTFFFPLFLPFFSWQDAKDVLAALDYVIEKGLIDAKKVVVVGGSHGGFLTTHLIGQVIFSKLPYGTCPNNCQYFTVFGNNRAIFVEIFANKTNLITVMLKADRQYVIKVGHDGHDSPAYKPFILIQMKLPKFVFGSKVIKLSL